MLMIGAAVIAMPARAQQQADTASPEAATNGDQIVVTATRTTRSSVELGAAEIQKVLPGANPVKAIQTLPGVQFETADPWGNNEQNIALFVHGFNQNQLGFTLDGVPLGDQSYGNDNGLSPQRAVISENVARVRLTAAPPLVPVPVPVPVPAAAAPLIEAAVVVAVVVVVVVIAVGVVFITTLHNPS